MLKKIIKKATILVTMISIAYSVSAFELQDLNKRFINQENVSAQFYQERNLTGLEKPLVTEGSMLISREHGLLWMQQKPFILRFILTDNTMVQVLQNQKATVISAQDNPKMFEFNSILKAIFVADEKTLLNNFDINLKELDQDGFLLTLKPKVSPLDKIFDYIKITGHQYVDEIFLADKNNESTKILFKDQKTLPNPLDKNYLKLYEYE